MIIDIEKISNSEWVEYQPGVKLKICPISVSKMAELRKKATVKKFENGQFAESFDEAKYEKLVRGFVIEDWEGITDPEGNKLPCTDDVKFLVLDYFHEIRGFVLKMASELQTHREEQAKKNEPA